MLIVSLCDRIAPLFTVATCTHCLATDGMEFTQWILPVTSLCITGAMVTMVTMQVRQPLT